MITIKSLQVKYNETVALNITAPITFEAHDRIGIIGSNGAGKTTLVKSILGLTNYKGSICTNIKPEEMAAHMQENNYVITMPIKYIMETILDTKIKENQKLQELIEFFNFKKCLNKKFNVLSGGEKQRLTIILVLMKETPLIFFDEVTTGLDFETRQQLIYKIEQWYKDKDTTICMISHYYEELEQMVNKLLILDKGEVVAFGSKKELFKKYCGNSIIILDNNEKDRTITENFKKISSPRHLIAISCSEREDEKEISQKLIEENINFRRSNNDIEILYINAKEEFEKGKGTVDSYEYKVI